MAGAEGQTARVMAAGGETPTRRRQRPLRVSAYPASTQRRAALTAQALRGAGGSLGGGGAGQTARLSNGRAPWAARGGAPLPLEGSGPRPPARQPPSPISPSLPPSLPERPARLPGSHFPPTRFAALGGQAGMEPSCSRRSSLPPPLPGEKCSQISRLPFLPLFRLSPRPVATYLSGRETYTKNTGFRFTMIVALNPGCVTLSKLLNLSASVSSSVKRLGRIRGNA